MINPSYYMVSVPVLIGGYDFTEYTSLYCFDLILVIELPKFIHEAIVVTIMFQLVVD